MVMLMALVAAPVLVSAAGLVSPLLAQTPAPLLGFMPPYEITRIVRYAGFEPLAPPLREGTTYVLRATDFRGILMRVVVDARSGAIRAVNRIVPGPAFGGPVGMAAPYGVPPAYGGPQAYAPLPFDDSAAEPQDAVMSVTSPHAPHPAALSSPPLPRPRPAELAAHRPADEAKPAFAASPAASPPAGKPTSASGAQPPPIND
jgi:hypothetical protein